MKEINDQLDKMENIQEHYLIKARNEAHPYYFEFLEASKIMKSAISEKEFNFWLTEKMLIKQQAFLEKTFIQYAVETATVRYFAEFHNENFKVEAKINPENDKDVDLRFTNSGYTYNIEVKCSDFNSKEKIDKQDAFKYDTVGRIPERQETKNAISTAIDEGLEKKGEQIKPHLEAKNMDNNMKDFLELSHEKFNSIPNENEVNILLVGCDDAQDMQKWHFYIYAEQGLFTQNSFADKKKYENVDLVIFANLYFKHNKYFNKNSKNFWTLKNGFNLVFSNPFRKINKESAIKNFIDFFPHYTWELNSFIVPGDVPRAVKDAVRIPHFVRDYLEIDREIYLFNEDPAIEDPRKLYVDPRNLKLFNGIESQYKVRLRYFDAPYEDGYSPWQCIVNKNEKIAKIQYFEKPRTTGYFTHELFHIDLIQRGFLTSDELIESMTPLFPEINKYSISNFNNIIAHPRFYEDFIQLKYHPSDFLCDFSKDYAKEISEKKIEIEKCFKEKTYGIEGINAYLNVFFLIIFNKNDDFNEKYSEEKAYLKAQNKELFEIINEKWLNWIESKGLDNLEFFTSLIRGINEWKKDKVVLE